MKKEYLKNLHLLKQKLMVKNIDGEFDVELKLLDTILDDDFVLIQKKYLKEYGIEYTTKKSEYPAMPNGVIRKAEFKICAEMTFADSSMLKNDEAKEMIDKELFNTLIYNLENYDWWGVVMNEKKEKAIIYRFLVFCIIAILVLIIMVG